MDIPVWVGQATDDKTPCLSQAQTGSVSLLYPVERLVRRYEHSGSVGTQTNAVRTTNNGRPRGSENINEQPIGHETF